MSIVRGVGLANHLLTWWTHSLLSCARACENHSKMSREGKAEYPDPLVIPPLRTPHKQSLIILHGRGSNARAFGPELLIQRPLGNSTNTCMTLRDLLPHASFIFPTAALRRARLFSRSIIHQVRQLAHLDAFFFQGFTDGFCSGSIIGS
jgi:hypothetical protein